LTCLYDGTYAPLMLGWYCACHFDWIRNGILIYCNPTINFHIIFYKRRKRLIVRAKHKAAAFPVKMKKPVKTSPAVSTEIAAVVDITGAKNISSPEP
jgi:hypothetical protein